MQLNFVEIIASFMVLFAIIDIFGSIPIILNVKSKIGNIYPVRTTAIAFAINLMLINSIFSKSAAFEA